MTMAKNEDVGLDRPQPSNHTVSTGADGLDRFAAGASILEQVPVGPFMADVYGSPPLICTVIPLLKIGIELHSIPETRQLAGAASPHEGAAENFGEGDPG